MNKQSNTYTILYIIIMVAIVGTALTLTAMALKPRQQANADADRMKQILAAVHISATDTDVHALFDSHITGQLVVNAAGDTIGTDAFAVEVRDQTKIKDPAARALPVYICNAGPGKGTKYILPVYGAGLWGPIWGYIAVNADGSTIYGAYFDHQGETPGLGAEIAKPAFSGQFDGKTLIHDNTFIPVAVVKKGQKGPQGADTVDAVSGGTITSKGVSAMLDDCLKPYAAWLQKTSGTNNTK